jgi:DNA-binding response OmpR family regulator
VSNSETIEDPAAKLPAKRVLLVENDFLIAMTVAEQLDELGYAVVGPAYGLAEGCQLAADAPIDAALLDWNLDGRGAGAVADILIKRKIPFVFVTGYAEIADAKYRAIPLLNKPFGIDNLGRTLEALLRGQTGTPEPKRR